jgi:hypothetical protein
MAIRTLTDLERRILAFEAKWEGRSSELKGSAARAEFGWSHAAYEQKLQALLMEPAAEVAEPLLVHRAIAVRESRVRLRAARTFQPGSYRAAV